LTAGDSEATKGFKKVGDIVGRQQDQKLRLPIGTDPIEVEKFNRIHARYVGAVRLFILRRNSKRDVEDLVQEVFLRFWQQRKEFRRDADVITYLIGIAKRILTQVHNENAPFSLLSDKLDLLDQIALEPFESQLYAKNHQSPESLSQMLAKLSPEQRQAVELVKVQDRDIYEAAKIMRCSADAARKRLDRGLRVLKKHFLQKSSRVSLKNFLKILFL